MFIKYQVCIGYTSIRTGDKTLPKRVQELRLTERQAGNINKWIAKANDSHHLLSLFPLSLCQQPFEKTRNHAAALHHMLSLLSIWDALSEAQWCYFDFALCYGNVQGNGRASKSLHELIKKMFKAMFAPDADPVPLFGWPNESRCKTGLQI